MYLVLIIPLAQPNFPFIEKSNHKALSVITTPAAWVPFQTARRPIFQRMETKPIYSSLEITTYSSGARRKTEKRHQRLNALSFLSLFQCASQACLPDDEERFVKRIMVERVEHSPPPGKIEGDICMQMETSTLHCIQADRKQSGQPGVSIYFFEKLNILLFLWFIFYLFFGGGGGGGVVEDFFCSLFRLVALGFVDSDIKIT